MRNILLVFVYVILWPRRESVNYLHVNLFDMSVNTNTADVMSHYQYSAMPLHI